ncbi:MAG: dicarboxylate/amino acid:cation symporter, partial [Gemmatimonadota bacterium]
MPRIALHTQILLGLVLGAVAGIVVGPSIAVIKPVGDLFIRLITMIVVPLVFASILIGVASLGDLAKLGRIGVKTIAYYLVTTSIAITIGLTLANIVQPGSRLAPDIKDRLLADFAGAAETSIEQATAKPSVVDTLLDIVPTNPAASMAEANMLQVIFFALVFGIALTYLDREKSDPVIRFMDAVNEAMIQLVHLVMKVAPYGVFALIAAIIGQYGLGILKTLVVYSLVVVVGLAIHMGVVYPTAVRLLAGMNPIHFFRGIAPAQLVAFSTSSSNATLPVTMECAEENLGVSEEVSAVVLPLGATINMD